MKTITLTTKENVTFKVTARKKEVSTAMLGDYHQVYTIVIERNGEKKNFTFHDSIHNFNTGKEADNQMLIDAVYCITCDCFAAENNPTFIEFANEFGYGDEQRGEARRTFNACHASLNKMLDLFSMDTIYDINWSITEEKIRVVEEL